MKGPSAPESARAILGALPSSPVLAEASPDSLSELFSRDPEGLSEPELDQIVDALRAQRERWMATQAATPERKKREAAKAPLADASTTSFEELGL